MSDRGHELTEELLEELEEEIKREYEKAVKDVEKKLQDYLEKTEKGRLEQKALLDAGEITQKQYNDWVYRHTMVGKRWEAMRDALVKDMVHADAVAQGLIRGKMPDVYALNMNFATFQIEHDGKIDTGFTLYNRDSAQYLLGDQRELMPGPSAKKSAEIRANKDMQWNSRHIQSAVLQGILQGESPYDVAARLQQVGQMDASASIRYARTMATSAQNAGRYQAFRRARSLGVELTIEWQATLDNRTRHEHRMMHGQRRNVDEPFVVDGIKILYPAEGGPGSSDIPQYLIWNCRCTLLSWVKGFEGDTVKSSPGMGDMSFEEWQQAKAHPDTKADREQFEEYKKLLGKDAPTSYNAFRKLKYDDPTAWADTKAYADYKRKYPNSSRAYFDVQKVARENGLKGSVALPPQKKRAYILPSGKRDPYHIMHRMVERGITDDDLRGYIDDAKIMFVQWGGARQVFAGEKGWCVVTKVDDDWLFRTAWTAEDFDEGTERIMEAIRNAGL